MSTRHVSLLFLIFICPSVLTGMTARKNTAIYIAITWDMPWSKFCYLGSLFKDKLSNELLEMKGAAAYRVEPRRIRYMNFDEECQNKGNDENALLELYVSKRTDLSHPDADKNMTYRAYNILYDYWRNKKMILLDKVFQGKVDEVELMGKDKPDTSRGLTDADRVGIGIGIGLAIVFLITAIYLIVAWKRKVKKPTHGVDLNVIPAQPDLTGDENGATVQRPQETRHWNSSDTGSFLYNRGYQDEPLDSTML